MPMRVIKLLTLCLIDPSCTRNRIVVKVNHSKFFNCNQILFNFETFRFENCLVDRKAFNILITMEINFDFLEQTRKTFSASRYFQKSNGELMVMKGPQGLQNNSQHFPFQMIAILLPCV